MLGLTWNDMVLKGNSLWIDDGDGDDNLADELWYNFQVTDNIAITPAFFYIENTGAVDSFRGMLKTTFSF